MPLLLIAMNMPVFGYAKPVPYNPAYFEDPRKGDLIVGLAGPAANLAMAALAGLVAWALYLVLPVAQLVQQNELFYYFYLMFLPMFALINLYLMFFNLLPIPPLDGGRFVVEIFQKGTRKTVSQKAMNYMSLAGMALFLGFFVIMLNQDIQRFVFGNWG